MLPPFSAAATSQTVVINQVEFGDSLTARTLNVVDTSTATSLAATATGNGLAAGDGWGPLDVEVAQSGDPASAGNVCAAAHLNVGVTVQRSGNACNGTVNNPSYGSTTLNAGQTSVTAAATANLIEVDRSAGAGPLTGNITQSTNPNITVKSEYDFNAPFAATADASVSSQAIANSIGIIVDGGAANLTTNQTSSATVDAEGGSEIGGGSGATLQYTPGTAAFGTIATTNNLSAIGTGGADQTINATQTSNGPLTQGGDFVNVGQAQTILGYSTVASNNLSIVNQNGPLSVAASQTNATNFTFADSVATAFQFGSGEATALGVGDSALVANSNGPTAFDNTQTNTGGMEASASFTGDGGVDASSSATAMGNSVTASCAGCSVTDFNNTQSSSGGGVEAFAATSVTGSSRSVLGSASAVGNNAVVSVSR